MTIPTIEPDFCTLCGGWDGKRTRPRTCVRIPEPKPVAVCLRCVAVMVERAMRDAELTNEQNNEEKLNDAHPDHA